jgi:hypothetical protein
LIIFPSGKTSCKPTIKSVQGTSLDNQSVAETGPKRISGFSVTFPWTGGVAASNGLVIASTVKSSSWRVHVPFVSSVKIA